MIIEQLKAMRLYRRMTATELSRRSGVPQATISLIENGKNNPTAETMERLATALDCKIRITPKEF